MSIECVDLLAFAESLRDIEDPTEVQLRASVSRAYYASLHRAQKAFRINIDRSSGSTHKAVIDELVLKSKAPGVGRLEAGKVAHQLSKLKQKRVDADYALDNNITISDANRGIEVAKVILGACDEAARRTAKS